MKESSLGISLRFVRIANYPLAALFLCLGRLCFAGGTSRSLLSLCSFDVSLRKYFGRSLRELPPQLTHRLSFSTFSRKSASRSLRVKEGRGHRRGKPSDFARFFHIGKTSFVHKCTHREMVFPLLKNRCSLNNNKALCKLCLRIKP